MSTEAETYSQHYQKITKLRDHGIEEDLSIGVS
jgi:hypothetical protein